MKYLVQGNYRQFKVTLTQKQGELITPYVPTDADEVSIMLRGARTYEYPDYEQSSNVLTFVDNGCLKVGLYALEVKIVESTTHRLRCMYREQIRVVASNDDVPTNADFEQDDVELQAEFDVAASVIVVDDELSLTSTNPVQNKVVTAALKTKYDSFYKDILPNAIDFYFIADGEYVGNWYIESATTISAGLMSAADKTKLDALPTNSALQTALNAKGDNLRSSGSGGGLDISLYRGDVELSYITIPDASAQSGGMMSSADYTKLAALPTNADLTTALNGKQATLTWDTVPTQNSENPVASGGLYSTLLAKEDKVAIEAPVNSVDAEQPITTLATETGKYYRIDVAVENLAITLPTITDNTKVQNVVLYLTGGTTPAVTFSGGTIYYQSDFAIEAGKTYEVNCLYNGVAWVVAAVEIDEV